jgi:hypothetical protein
MIIVPRLDAGTAEGFDGDKMGMVRILFLSAAATSS